MPVERIRSQRAQTFLVAGAVVVLALLGCGKQETASVDDQAEFIEWQKRYESAAEQSRECLGRVDELRVKADELEATVKDLEDKLAQRKLVSEQDRTAAAEQQKRVEELEGLVKDLKSELKRTETLKLRVENARQRLAAFAEALFHEGRFELALPVLATEAELDTPRLELPFELALSYAATGNYEDAARWYGRAVEVLQGDPIANKDALRKACNNYAVVLVRINRADEALQWYERAIELDRDSPAPYFNLGLLYEERLHRPAEAIEAYRRHILLGGRRSASAREAIARLQQVRPESETPHTSDG